MGTISTVLFAVAAVGLLVLLVQLVVLALHTAAADPVPAARPPVSILKPLCGADDDLAANLATFAALDWPEYEVLLGLPDHRDAALPVARAVARRWPERFRVVFQRGEPGANPKVNQLVTLARAARHDVLVVSDSNVRVARGYLAGIVAHLEDPGVGLVTHLVAGREEATLGSLLDSLHLAAGIAPSVVAAKRLTATDLVVGKSMALRRHDLEALGGFAAVKDVLAEDYVLGRWIGARLRRRVALAHAPVVNVTRARSVGEFVSRYARWAVMQRRVAGTPAYAAGVVMNPVLLAGAALAAAPTWGAAAACGAVCAARMALDAGCGRCLRPGGFTLRQLALVPLKDLLAGAAWAHGLVSDHVTWRGKRIRVLAGTRISTAAGPGERCQGARAAETT